MFTTHPPTLFSQVPRKHSTWQRSHVSGSLWALRGLSEVNSCFIQSSSVFKFSFNFCYDVMFQGLQRKAEKGMIDSVYYEIRKITGRELAWQQIRLNSNTGEASALWLTVYFPWKGASFQGIYSFRVGNFLKLLCLMLALLRGLRWRKERFIALNQSQGSCSRIMYWKSFFGEKAAVYLKFCFHSVNCIAFNRTFVTFG